MNRNYILGGFIFSLTIVLVYLVLSKSNEEANLDFGCAPNLDSPDAPGSGKQMNPSSLDKFRAFVALLGFCPTVNSAFRTHSHNAGVGGVSNSSHLSGHAFDISTRGLDQAWVIAMARQAGFNRIGIYTNHIHIDDDPSKGSAIWYG